MSQVNDLGGLLAVACANAANIQASRGLLGLLNTLGDWLLRAAHAARANTISGAHPPRSLPCQRTHNGRLESSQGAVASSCVCGRRALSLVASSSWTAPAACRQPAQH